jgi:hypothetical protein
MAKEFELTQKASVTVNGNIYMRGQNVAEKIYNEFPERVQSFFTPVGGKDMEEKPLEQYTKKELLAFAAENHPDLDVNEKMTNKEIVAAIEVAEAGE